MATRLQKDDNSSWKLGEDINELIASYIKAALNDEISATQTLMYFQNLFAHNAKRFYRSYMDPDSATFKKACKNADRV